MLRHGCCEFEGLWKCLSASNPKLHPQTVTDRTQAIQIKQYFLFLELSTKVRNNYSRKTTFYQCARTDLTLAEHVPSTCCRTNQSCHTNGI